MDTGFVGQVIYWFSTPVLVVLVGLLLWRRVAREFPSFVAYIAIALLGDVTRRATFHGNARTYFFTYWIADLVATIFVFFATNELFLKRLFPRFYKIALYRFLFPVAGLLIISFAVLTIFGGMKITILAHVIRTLDFLRVSVLFFFVALMVSMGRQWSRYEFGIAVGLGVTAAAFLTTFAIFVKFGPLHGILRDLPVLGEDTAVLIWLICFLRPEKSTLRLAQPLSPAMVHEARKWEETLKESLLGKKDPHQD